MTEKIKKDRMANIFWGQIFLGLSAPVIGCWIATQYVVMAIGGGYGSPLFVFAGVPIYAPWDFILWSYSYSGQIPSSVLENAFHIIHGSVFIFVIGIVTMIIRRNRRREEPVTYGSSKWATIDDLKDAALLENAGIILAQSYDAKYKPVIVKSGNEASQKWELVKHGKHLIRHSGVEHIFCFAPTRSGKTAGLVIPTLLTWQGSAIIYDIKKELWFETAGWRKKFSHCIRFEPTSPTSIRYNPLLEIRRGTDEVSDTQNVAEILVDPDGSKEQRDHWEKTGHEFLVGCILHVLYAEEDKTPAGLAKFIADPKRTIQQTLKHMLEYPHTDNGVHPVVATCARSMLNKSDNELSGVVSTAMTFLAVYLDEKVARATSCSDFRITDLIHSKCPVSLYIVMPPSDIDRLKPLMRLMMNQIGKRLCEKMESRNSTQHQAKHKLLMMLDEFPSLGRLGFFETSLAYMAGYGIRCFLVAQSLKQIVKVYGDNNSILDNAHIRVTYGANDEQTAKRISDLLGETTVERGQVNYGGSRFAPIRGHVMETVVESGRALLTPGEILQMPFDEAIIMVGNMRPYKAKKVTYYQDERFADRINLDAPEDDQINAQFVLHPERNEWNEYMVQHRESEMVQGYYVKLKAEKKKEQIVKQIAEDYQNMSPNLDIYDPDEDPTEEVLFSHGKKVEGSREEEKPIENDTTKTKVMEDVPL
jgi:type IV secretion system protein VirD4